MKNYTINAIQYHVLSSLLRVSQKRMCAQIKVTTNYMSRHLQDGDFRICDALAICNSYRIRFSSFITVGEQSLSGASITVPVDQWTGDIVYCPQRISDMVRDGRFTLKGIMRVTGWSHSTVCGLLKQDCPTSKLLSFCNAFGLNLSDFITDPTLPRLTTPSRELREENERLKAEILAVRAENFRLRRLLSSFTAYDDSHTPDLSVAEDVP